MLCLIFLVLLLVIFYIVAQYYWQRVKQQNYLALNFSPMCIWFFV